MNENIGGTNPIARNAEKPSDDERRTEVVDDEQIALPATNALTEDLPRKHYQGQCNTNLLTKKTTPSSPIFPKLG